MEVTVKSNKNTNRYQLNQEYRENYARQIIEEPSNIKGLTITQEENNLKIENTKLNLTSIYENYTYVAENHLFLNYFVEDYKNAQNSNAKEENDFIVLETDCRNQENKYNIRKKLYLQKNTGNEVKFEFLDLVELDGEEYVVLLPTEDEEENDEVVILKVEDTEGEEDMESYVSVDDEETLNKVFEMFKEKFKDEFNFVDED